MTNQLHQIYKKTLERVSSERLVSEWLSTHDQGCDWDILAIGKAATPMAKAAVASLGSRAKRGFLLTKDDHTDGPLPNFSIREAAHPVPDAQGMKATGELMSWLRESSQPRLLALVSGGASSLLVSPRPPLTLEDLSEVNRALLAAGIPIETMNVLRKHISEVKGGQLAALSGYEEILQLLMVDIACPSLSSEEIISLVGSGPLAPDPSSLTEAQEILGNLTLTDELRSRCEEALAETPTTTITQSVILADHVTLRETAESLLGESLLRDSRWPADIEGDVREVASQLARVAISLQEEGQSGVLVATGEPTVNLCSNPGRGGRCQELAMHFCRNVSGRKGITFLAGSSDGTDGPTEDAGALVDDSTWTLLITMFGADGVTEMVETNDCGSALAALPGAVITTGPTGQNLNDLYMVKVES